jgi:glycosyltransferase involved in cell wall biosynthesis
MILIVSAVFPPEPVVSAFLSYDLALLLAEKYEVKVLTPRPTRPGGVNYDNHQPLINGVEQIVLNSFTCPQSRLIGRMRESLSFGLHASAYIKNHSSDIQVVYMNTWPLLAQYIIARTARKFKIPVITHIQDIYPEGLMDKIPVLGKWISKILLPIDKITIRNSSRLITISKGMSDYLIRTRKISSNKIQVIYNWQDEKPFTNYISQSRSQLHAFFTFMYLGNLNKTASIHLFINAILQGEFSNVRLVIAGSGYHKKQLQTLAGSNPLIEFCDAPKAKVPEIQDQSDVLLLALPKNYASFALPSKLIAYMFSKKPIIACVDVDSEIAQVIKESDSGWIVPPEDINALIMTMKQILSIPAVKLEAIGENGYKFASKYFSKNHNLRLLYTTVEDSI